MFADITYIDPRQTTIDRVRLARLAPSVFGAGAHARTSTRYAYIPTARIVEGLEAEGWMVVDATERRVREVSREGFQKHMLRFRHRDHLGAPAVVGAEVPEIVLINSHDGSSTYQLHAGFFRFVCCNGMVIASSRIAAQTIKHSGDVVGNVIEGVYRVVEEFPGVLEQIEESKRVRLSDPERIAFARAAMALRWDKPEESGFSPEQIATPRRAADAGDDLWSAFNRAQEHLIRGGLQGTKRDANGRTRRTTSREVKGIDQSVAINKALWTLAEEMRKLIKGV